MEVREIAQLKDDVIAYIERSEDHPARFDELVLRTWRWHMAAMPAYRRFCLGRLQGRDSIAHWRDLPALPVEAFKLTELACGPKESIVRRFTTSGTSGGASRVGVAPFDDHALAVMERAIEVNARRSLFADG